LKAMPQGLTRLASTTLASPGTSEARLTWTKPPARSHRSSRRSRAGRGKPLLRARILSLEGLEGRVVADRRQGGVGQDLVAPERGALRRAYHRQRPADGFHGAAAVPLAPAALGAGGLGEDAGDVVHHLRRPGPEAEGLLGVGDGFPRVAEHHPGQAPPG